ncbi:hypothetical protein BDZ45DRAFT_732637 [Acephala macrosclerotiorum]|nr:hypothetical protein BDZ45DRAFT_732637 [Acephala macrosclerotiorum]
MCPSRSTQRMSKSAASRTVGTLPSARRHLQRQRRRLKRPTLVSASRTIRALPSARRHLKKSQHCENCEIGLEGFPLDDHDFERSQKPMEWLYATKTESWERWTLATSVKEDFVKAMEQADVPANVTTAIMTETEHLG